MQVKRFEAANIREALAKIKSDLGPDAIVLSTKRLPGEKKLIEVMAARDDGPAQQTLFPGDFKEEEKKNASLPEDRQLFGSLTKDIREIKALILDVKKERLVSEFAELKESLHNFFDVLGMHGHGKEKNPLTRIYQHLLGRGISPGRACKLLEEMKGNFPDAALCDYEGALQIAESIIRGSFAKLEGKKEKRIKVFLGPTGVGKTTTLAKLAAHFAIDKKNKVGLVSMDTFRIAALEQLKIYSRIMDLPLEVATEKVTFTEALRSFEDKDVILVDTPGKSRSDALYLQKLQEILAGQRDVETNLLLSLTSSRENMREVYKRFNGFNCDQIILTKLDEADHCGYVYDLLEQTGKTVSYVTTGQNVPQDIRKIDATGFAELIMRN